MRAMSADKSTVERLGDTEILQRWAEAGLYQWSPDLRRSTFSCVIPAPNATGELHLGHALNLSIQDILCRSHRREGRAILWAGALDHGSFSTQSVVERQMRAAGGDKATSNVRDVERAIRAWIAKISPRIFEQFRQFGVLMDMDPQASMWDPCNEALTHEYFLELHARGLVYEAADVTDWCPRCKTALDKIDQVPSTVEETVFTVRYRAMESDSLVLDVPTAAPEILHVAVALVVPDHGTTFAAHQGQKFQTAFGNPIPLFVAERTGSDESVALVAPAHCAFSNRFAKRLGLSRLPAFDADGVIIGGPFAGKSRCEARQLAAALLAERGALVSSARRMVSRPACKKCLTAVESFTSRQWFLRVQPLLEPTLDLLKQGQVRLHPKRYETHCKVWLSQQIEARRRESCDEMVDDWCISRQIQCGSRIPMCRCSCGRIEVGHEALPCAACGGSMLPVHDVIDMRLADALWAFCANRRYTSDSAALANIGNSAACVTGLDLLFYWIMPIVMLGTKLGHPLPFRDVVIHPIICDALGNKMGKSVGNVVVPSEIIARYGADCLRLTLLDGLDLLSEKLFFSEEKLERNRQWLDRLVTAARALMSRSESGLLEKSPDRMTDLGDMFRGAIDGYRLSELHPLAFAAIERLERAREEGETARDGALGDALVLLHPLAPLTTESLWQQAFPEKGLLATHVEPSKRSSQGSPP